MNPREKYLAPRGKTFGHLSQLELLIKPVKSSKLFGALSSWSRAELFNPFVLGGNCCVKELYRLSGPNPQASQMRENFVDNESIDSCDVLIVSGIINSESKAYIKEVYNKMAEPRYVVAIGGCSASGAIFDTMALDEILPVDIYIAGCPPTLESLKEGIALLRERMRKGVTRELLERRLEPSSEIQPDGQL